MSGWPITKLGDIFNIARGGSPRPIQDYWTNEPDGINWVMISDASSSSKFITTTKKKIIPEGVKRSRMVGVGDFILSNSMSFGRPYIMQTSGCIHDGWLVLSPLQRNVDSNFFYHLLGSDLVYAQFVKRAAGATVKNLNIDLVRSVEIPLPPLAEQRRIADILDRAEDLRAKRRTALQHLDELTQSLFLDMFGDPATNPNKWPVEPITSLCDSSDDIKCGPFGTQLGKHEFTTEGVPLWGIKHVNVDFALQTDEFVDEKTAERLAVYSTLPGDIVMTRKGTIGNCAIYPDRFPRGIMHSDLLRLRVSSQACNPIYLTHQLRFSREITRQLQIISGGAVMPGINVTRLKEILVQRPPLELQNEYAKGVAKIEFLRVSQKETQIEMDELFASLQQRAFRGEEL